MDDSGPAFSHFGICVSDLERSLAFYCGALGFEKAESHEIGSEFAALMDLPDVAVTSQFIRRGPTAIELLGFREPSPFGEADTAGGQPVGTDPSVVPGPRRGGRCGQGRRVRRRDRRVQPHDDRLRRNRARVPLLHGS